MKCPFCSMPIETTLREHIAALGRLGAQARARKLGSAGLSAVAKKANKTKGKRGRRAAAMKAWATKRRAKE